MIKYLPQNYPKYEYEGSTGKKERGNNRDENMKNLRIKYYKCVKKKKINKTSGFFF